MNDPGSSVKLRPLWRKLFPSTLVLVALVFLGTTGLRVYGYFGPRGFNGPIVMLGFLLMWLVPWIFLTGQGRQAIGIKRPEGLRWLLVAPLAGSLLAVLGYGLGDLLYGNSTANWYQSVAASYFSDERVLEMSVNQLFLMFTIPAMLFSPIGEEILFRGLIQQTVAERWGRTWGIGVAAFLFAGVHLLHHGIFKDSTGWSVLWTSGGIWWLLIFSTGVVFSWLRLRYLSLAPSIAAHACFNLVMNATIFYILLE